MSNYMRPTTKCKHSSVMTYARKLELEFLGANAEGVYTQCQKKRKTMKETIKINNPSEGGGMNENATRMDRQTLAKRQSDPETN
ncbi:hypothetical protein TNCV_1238761 [Trichonephila clavipes]|nr:hypothetical protein TNCV_1238761 [Trichonephila clavipes]